MVKLNVIARDPKLLSYDMHERTSSKVLNCLNARVYLDFDNL